MKEELWILNQAHDYELCIAKRSLERNTKSKITVGVFKQLQALNKLIDVLIGISLNPANTVHTKK